MAERYEGNERQDFEKGTLVCNRGSLIAFTSPFFRDYYSKRLKNLYLLQIGVNSIFSKDHH